MHRDLKRTLPWLLVALLSGLVIVWAFPRAIPFYPERWTVDLEEAEAIALGHFDRLGEPVADPLVVTDLSLPQLTERRLVLETTTGQPAEVEGPSRAERLRASTLGRRILAWRVTVYESGAFPGEWVYRALVGADGELFALQARVDPELALEPIDPEVAVSAADRFLEGQGFDLAAYARPVLRSQQLQARTDLTLRYRERDGVFGESFPYGVEVTFAGDRLAGFATWGDDGGERQLQAELQPLGLLGNLQFLGAFLFAPLVGVLFLRRYHAGEVGVSQASKIFLLMFSAGTVVVLTQAAPFTEGAEMVGGIFSRVQWMLVWALQFEIIMIFPMALVGFLAWSVGESLCREASSSKLAAFDALFRGAWANATVARASLRGVAAGLGLLALLLAGTALLRPWGVSSQISFILDGLGTQGPFLGLASLLIALVFTLYRELLGRLLLVPLLARPLGLWLGGALVAVITGVLILPSYTVLPLSVAAVGWILYGAILVALFIRYDLLTVLLASFTFEVTLRSLPLVFADSPSLVAQGWLAVGVLLVPLALSVRYLGSGREFVYRYDDIPPHVRRIAERERQRVELETARNIQSSILPDLPPRLHGVEMAHAYLPATEVGGDFYDVLALEDGRLAVAVGDVAGHGVSSGLVMSAAKSALAVQVSFNPEVEAVVSTLNRMVYQSARRRLITTLCYALLDPQRRELIFTSAGHLYPYLLSPDGRVRALASTAYPLGVRPELAIQVNRQHLEADDTLVLLSDGIVEARPEGSNELFGFDRLETSLSRHAQGTVEEIRDGLLRDVARFVGPSPREDDQTLLVLRVP